MAWQYNSSARSPLLLGLALIAALAAPISAKGARPPTQYLLFQIFLGGPNGGVFQKAASKDDMLRIARKIAESVRPAQTDPRRILGFSIGPVAPDEGEDEVRSSIRDAFDVALMTDMAVALHLDDYMFWARARLPDGRRLRDIQGTVEWRDWSGTPAEELQIGWLPNARLSPQICYENPSVRQFATYWTRDVIGQEVKRQYERLAQAGKARLFAGVIIGWETNLAYGYCSLSYLGYSAQRQPADFDRAREQVLQRHIERWAEGIHDAGIPGDLIFTHLGPISKRAHNDLMRMVPVARLRELHQSTGLRAFWAAFNRYSMPGFSAYADDALFEDIYQAVRDHGTGTWAMVEGTNVTMPPGRPPLTWERYLARSFNHGAKMVNIFGGFQGPGAGEFGRSTESSEAIAAYQKFLRGGDLAEAGNR